MNSRGLEMKKVIFCIVMLFLVFGFAFPENTDDWNWGGLIKFKPLSTVLFLIQGGFNIAGYWVPYVTPGIGIPIEIDFTINNGTPGVGISAGIEVIPLRHKEKSGLFLTALIGAGFIERNIVFTQRADIGYQLVTDGGFVFTPAIGVKYNSMQKIEFDLMIDIGFGYKKRFGNGTSNSTPEKTDTEKSALKETFDNASWIVKPMSKNHPITNDFKEVDKMELAAFQNISITQKMELGRWYALTAPELPGTYYYYQKSDSGSLFRGPLVYLYKSTTIDEETFAFRTAFFSATWQVRSLENQPSTAGLEKLDRHGVEALYFDNLLIHYETWHSFTAPEMPGMIYYYFRRKTTGVITIGESVWIYKGKL